MVDLNSYRSVITLNISGLSILIKRYRQMLWDYIKTIFFLSETCLKSIKRR